MERRRQLTRFVAASALCVREQALAGLPEEFGFTDLRQFFRVFRIAAVRCRIQSRGLVRPGGTKLIRRRVAKLLLRGRGGVEIALELGLSLRLVDRVVTGLKNPQKLMNSDKIEALAAAKARVAQLEKSLAADLERELASLPAQYGFTTVAEFVAALKAADRLKQGSPPRRKRTVITESIRRDIRRLVEAGKTGVQIARELDISTSSVQVAKRTMGITHKG